MFDWMTNWISTWWQTPSVAELAARELGEAERMLLEAQTGRDYANAMCQFREAQIARLSRRVKW